MTVTLTLLASFNGDNASDPEGSLIADTAGNLFGTTGGGGSSNDGTVFELTPNGSGSYTTTMLVTFTDSNGANPDGSLITDAAGNLFGTTEQGNPGDPSHGTVFELTPNGGGYTTTTLASFNFATGAFPEGSLIADAAGDLFGTTDGGGSSSEGTVFELTPNGSGGYTATTLVTFTGSNGAFPQGSLAADAAGDLLGTTRFGGATNDGTVFELTPNGSGGYTTTTLVSFNGTNGQQPAGDLITDAAGDLFGTTYAGGSSDVGTVFELTPDGSGGYTTTTLVTFNGANGEHPLGGLIADAAGDLFGTTLFGGSSADGTVFELTPDGSGGYTTTTLVNFNRTDGAGPSGSLIADAAGDLFGTTQVGGSSTGGTVFELTNTGFVVCFLAGSLIATPDGEVAVERLAAGDQVITLSGKARRIVWIGTGQVLATRGRRNAPTPVIVRRGALADNVPHTDLRVTKAHGLYLDGVLIPVEFLVNHKTILWDDHAQEVTIYHIELETHDVILANGAPAESYRDDGNRWLFRNANTGWHLPPQEPCVPVMTGGPIVDTVWRRLLDRAGPRQIPPLTDDADLHLVVDGQRVDASEKIGGIHIFRLPAVPSTLSIASRAAVPTELGLARDPRPLGVALRRFQIGQGTRFRTIDASDEQLGDGFHTFESGEGYRWTDGLASLPISLFSGFTGPVEVVFIVGATARYLEDGHRRRAA